MDKMEPYCRICGFTITNDTFCEKGVVLCSMKCSNTYWKQIREANKMNDIDKENDEVEKYNQLIDLENQQWDKIADSFEQVSLAFKELKRLRQTQ